LREASWSPFDKLIKPMMTNLLPARMFTQPIQRMGCGGLPCSEREAFYYGV